MFNSELFFGSIGAFIGMLAMAAVADYSIKVQDKTVDCVEYVRVGNFNECAVFEWRGEKYATEFAPIVSEEPLTN